MLLAGPINVAFALASKVAHLRLDFENTAHCGIQSGARALISLKILVVRGGYPSTETW